MISFHPEFYKLYKNKIKFLKYESIKFIQPLKYNTKTGIKFNFSKWKNEDYLKLRQRCSARFQFIPSKDTFAAIIHTIYNIIFGLAALDTV